MNERVPKDQSCRQMRYDEYLRAKMQKERQFHPTLEGWSQIIFPLGSSPNLGIWLASRELSGNWRWHSLPLSPEIPGAPTAKCYSIPYGPLVRGTESMLSLLCSHSHWEHSRLLGLHGSEGVQSFEGSWCFCFHCSSQLYKLLINTSPPPPLDRQPWEGSTTLNLPVCSHGLAPNKG